MPIENRNLEAGTKLIAGFKKVEYRAEVIAGEGEGKFKYKLADGREFKSPSAAGTAITGGACNGWSFWRIATTEPQALEVAAEQSEDSGDTEALDQSPTVGFKRVPNQKGVEEG